jgi:hypothetical protein
MAKRTLRDLSRIIPTEGDFDRIEREVETGSNRHFVLTWSIDIENTLRHAITTVLPKNDRSIIDRMTDRDGVLSTFSRKIDLGYALALYDTQLLKDLNIIRNIRNAFAHTLLPIDLNTTELATEITKLKSTTNRDKFKYPCHYVLAASSYIF